MIAPQYNSLASSLRVAIMIFWAIVGAGLTTSNNIFAEILGIFVLGAMFAHAIELQHQCLHFSAFRSRRTNKITGVLLGLPTLTSFHAYRRSHLEHHRNLGTPADESFFNYKYIASPTLGALVLDLFGFSHLKASVSAILGNGDSRLIAISQRDQPSNMSEQFDYALMGFLIVCACLIAMVCGPAIVIKLWILPFLLVAQPIHFLIELPEHFGCDARSTDVYRNTRTIAGSKFSRWFTNSNNLHVEHHLEATVSMDQLPAVFELVQGQHKHIMSTYWQFYMMLYKSVGSQSLASGADNQVRRPA
jgi:fatty acid desaturase